MVSIDTIIPSPSTTRRMSLNRRFACSFYFYIYIERLCTTCKASVIFLANQKALRQPNEPIISRKSMTRSAGIAVCARFGEQGWRSNESTCLPPVWPRFEPPGVISWAGCVWSSGWMQSWIGLLLLTVSEVSTTCAVVILRVKVRCITSVDGLKLWLLIFHSTWYRHRHAGEQNMHWEKTIKWCQLFHCPVSVRVLVSSMAVLNHGND